MSRAHIADDVGGATRLSPTDFREETLTDVIILLEPELFQRVADLAVNDCEALCDVGVFSAQAMNSGPSSSAGSSSAA